MEGSVVINGLVLAGGYSTRMGCDKGMLSYREGMPQRDYLFRLLGRYCSDVFTSCRKEQALPEGLNPLYDAYPIQGPLNGILSAFRYRRAAWLVVAVDMPFVDDSAIEALITNRDSYACATCFFNNERNAAEPLAALWEPVALPLLVQFAEQGGRSPSKFLATHRVRMVDPPDPRMLLNINSPADALTLDVENFVLDGTAG